MYKYFLFFILSISLAYSNAILIDMIKKDKLLEDNINFIDINITNKTKNIISSKDNFFLSYHLYSLDNKLIKFDNTRTKINILANNTQNIKLKLAPLKAGKYILEIDILKEKKYWLKLNYRLELQIDSYFGDYQECNRKFKRTCWYIDGEDSINRLWFIIARVLKFSQKRLKKFNISGFSAGSIYLSQIWIRDSYTILTYSKYLYKEPFLSSWLFYMLDNIKNNGLIYDWFDSSGHFDKNTVESDQESSLALAYFELLEIDRDRYINRLDDIERLLSNLWRLKRDKSSGLIVNAHTIDWGDVQYGATNWKDAVYFNNNSFKVVGIYTNAIFYSAIEKLLKEYKKLDKKKYLKWKNIQNRLKIDINSYLWNKERGFYRIHKHVSYLKHPFDEDNIFAMGGNSVALSTSLVDKNKIKSIINTALKREKLFNISTISGVLLPPYPRNYYKYHIVDDYFEYQNGGQWDWFGARLLKIMFLNNFEKVGLDELRKIAQKIVKNRTISEWNDTLGNHRGSSNYAGAGGVLGNAIVEGLFGIKLRDGKIYIDRVPKMNKKFLLNLYIPQNNLHIFYRYDGKCFLLNSNKVDKIELNIDNICFKVGKI